MNIIPASVVTTVRGMGVELLGRQVEIPLHRCAALADLKRVEVGIRPQALRLVPPGPDHIVGRVFLREPLGLEDEILVQTSDGTLVKVVTVAADMFPEGTTVGLDFAPRDLFLFQPEEGVAVLYGID